MLKMCGSKLKSNMNTQSDLLGLTLKDSPTILRNFLCLFLQDLVNLKETQLLIGYTVMI